MDDMRRPDVPVRNWQQRFGEPQVTHVPGLDNGLGLASEDRREVEAVRTEQGTVKIGYGGNKDLSWLPTVGDLQEAPFFDSRLTAISDRYYR